jgi:hypothetical protein
MKISKRAAKARQKIRNFHLRFAKIFHPDPISEKFR